MVMRSLGLVAILGGVAGCYSTPAVDPYPDPNGWLIDDFESGDGVPKAPGFEKWECRPREGTRGVSQCEVIADPGYLRSSQNRVLYLASTLLPPEGDHDDFTRAEVATTIELPQDLTAYERISLKARLDWQGGTAPTLKIQLSCLHVRAADGGVSPNPCVLAPLELLTTDGPYTGAPYGAGLSAFNAPAERRRAGDAVNPHECLAHVDGIKITVDAAYPSADAGGGQALDFQLYVDDIRFHLPRTGSH